MINFKLYVLLIKLLIKFIIKLNKNKIELPVKHNNFLKIKLFLFNSFLINKFNKL